MTPILLKCDQGHKSRLNTIEFPMTVLTCIRRSVYLEKETVMNSKQSGDFEILSGYPADVLAISAIGHIDQDAYTKTLIPALEKVIAREGKAKVLYMMGPEFTGFSAGAAYEDAKYGLTHLADFAQAAIVTDVEWVRTAMKLFMPFMGHKMKLFAVSELDAAKDWIDAYHPDAGDPEPEVAAKKVDPPADDLA